MLSEKQLQESVNASIANLLAEQVIRRIKAELQSQYDQVIYEMASTRRTNEQLKQQLTEVKENYNRLEQILENYNVNQTKDEQVRKKQIKLLDAALKELNMEE